MSFDRHNCALQISFESENHSTPSLPPHFAGTCCQACSKPLPISFRTVDDSSTSSTYLVIIFDLQTRFTLFALASIDHSTLSGPHAETVLLV